MSALVPHSPIRHAEIDAAIAINLGERRRLDELILDLLRWRNGLLTVSRLPDELLAEIFDYVVQSPFHISVDDNAHRWPEPWL